MIKPKWAITIWNNTDWIYADLGGYVIKVEFSIEGMGKLLIMLRARMEDARFSTEGCPTQDQINHVFYGRRKKTSKRKPQMDLTKTQLTDATKILRDLGLI